MSDVRKLELLAGQAAFDLSCACGLEPSRRRAAGERWVVPIALPDGRRLRTLKVLLDNRCPNDCVYCAQRAAAGGRRAHFRPEELARLTAEMVRAGRVEALFLSSGLGPDPVRTMDSMLAAVEILRRRHHHRGFIHLKVLPGAQRAQIERGAQLAQRLSINLEVPAQRYMRALSRRKDLDGDIRQRLAWIAAAVADPRSRARGHTTQFVVGAAGERDRDIVRAAGALYRDQGLSRAYYSKFQPLADTPLAQQAPVPFMREHRLYQADFLLRCYGFAAEEIPFGPGGDLDLEQDPKARWASLHPERFPLEVNRAAPAALLRVPGLGPTAVRRIVAARRRERLRRPEELARLGVRLRAAAGHLLLEGRLASSWGQQRLF